MFYFSAEVVDLFLAKKDDASNHLLADGSVQFGSVRIMNTALTRHTRK